MVLELKQVNKTYYRGKNPVPVLRDVNLQVEKGEYIAIMGPSGSGKTTLMNLLGCLDLATSGTYILDGQDIGTMNHNRLAEIRNKYIGFIFQNFHLLPKLTALDNVALPLLYGGMGQRERKELARKALTAVGLADRMRFYPNQLSGGQCQRVAIARAMVGSPQVLLADEPTGALDTASGRQIMEIFRQLSQQGVTIIMITHDPEVAAWADKTYYIRDGRISRDPDSFDGMDDSFGGIPQDTPAPSPDTAPEEGDSHGQE